MASGHVSEHTLEINSSPSVLQLCWGRVGGVTSDEKGVFIQIQNSIVRKR